MSKVIYTLPIVNRYSIGEYPYDSSVILEYFDKESNLCKYKFPTEINPKSELEVDYFHKKLLCDLNPQIFITQKETGSNTNRLLWYYFSDHKQKETDIIFDGEMTTFIAHLIVHKVAVAVHSIKYKNEIAKKNHDTCLIISQKVSIKKSCIDLIKRYIICDKFDTF